MRDQSLSQTSSALVLPQCNELSFQVPADPASGMQVNHSTPEHWNTAAATQLEFGNYALDFMPHFGESWQPVETIQQSMMTRGLPPWTPSGTNEVFDETFSHMPSFSVYRNGV